MPAYGQLEAGSRVRSPLRAFGLFVLFCALPVALAWAAGNSWLSWVEERRAETAFREMERALVACRDDIVLELDRGRLFEACRRAAEALPVLDEAHARAFYASFEARHPGLLTLALFAADPARDTTPTFLAPEGLKFRSAFAMFGEGLAHAAGWVGSELPRAKAELVHRHVLGNRATIPQVSFARGGMLETIFDGRTRFLFWDAVAESGARLDPKRWRGILVVMIDVARFREIHFTPARIVARRQAELAPLGIALRPFLASSATDEALLYSLSPPLAERARSTFRGVITSRGPESLDAAVMIRDGDRLVVHARKEAAGLAPDLARTRLWLAVSLACYTLAFLALLWLVQVGALDFRVPIRLQVAAIFFAAGVLPLALAAWVGFRFVAVNREVMEKRAAELLRSRVLGCDDQAAVERGALFRLSESLRTGEAARAAAAWMELARGRGVEPLDIGTAEIRACFSTLDTKVAELIADEIVDDCFVYDAAGRQVFRACSGQGPIRMMETDVYNRVTELIIHFVNTGLSDLPPERRRNENDFIGRMLLSTGGRKEVLDGLIRNRGVIHPVDLFEFKAYLYFEPIYGDDRRAVAAIIVNFNMKKRMRKVAAALVAANRSAQGERALLFSADTVLPGERHPSPEVFDDDLSELVRRAVAERAAVEATVRHRGEWMLAYAAPMRELTQQVMVGLYPLAEIERDHARDVRLLAVAFIVTLLVVFGASLALSARLLRPIALLTAGVERVRGGDLACRIDTGTRDEFGALAETLNDTVSRLGSTLGDLAASNERLERANASLDRRLRELSVLYDVSQKLHVLTEMDQLVRVILERVREVFDAHHTSVLMLSADGSELELRQICGVDPPSRRIALRPDEGIAGLVLADGRTRLVNEVAGDERFKPLEYSHERRRMRSLLCAPLVIGKKPAGVINVVDRMGEGAVPFAEEDVQLLESIASQLSLTIEIFELHRDLIDRERMTKELEIARSIQSRLLPAAPPVLPGFTVDHHNEPAREVGGDYYDHFPLPGGATGFAIGDVAGKGVPAGLIMVMVRSVLRVEAEKAGSPADVVATLNDHVGSLVADGRFVTFLYGTLSADGTRFAWANAGHNFPYLYRAARREVEEMEGGGLILGVMAGMPYTTQEAELSPGDAILFYTDGVTEAQNAAGELFGEERLKGLFASVAHLPAAGIRRAVEEAVVAFEAGAPRADDLTLLVIKRDPAG